MRIAWDAILIGTLLHGWWVIFGFLPLVLIAAHRRASTPVIVFATVVLIGIFLCVGALVAWWQWPLNQSKQRTMILPLIAGPCVIGLTAAECIRRTRTRR